jgi:hypothetical protein
MNKIPSAESITKLRSFFRVNSYHFALQFAITLIS